MLVFFFFNDTATTEIYTLSLHDALPISSGGGYRSRHRLSAWRLDRRGMVHADRRWRSEEHTSELQSHSDLVCRLLLEKKKKDAVRGAPVTKESCRAEAGCVFGMIGALRR